VEIDLRYIGLALIELLVIARVILRPHRDPSSRIAWVVVVAVMPVIGVIAYLLFGETSIGQQRVTRARKVLAEMPPPIPVLAAGEIPYQPEFPERFAPVFRMGETINGFKPVGGNNAKLMTDSNSGIDSMVADMDAATDHIHVLFYIWLTDNNGLKVVEALKRAAARGVACRAMADGLGSHAMLSSRAWKEMRKAGVHVATALPIGNPLLRPLHGRIDLRNHRKITVIDDRITYCGSQNCADPEFRVKPKYAPWVDALMRFEGPIARQNQRIFVADWMADVDEDIRGLLEAPVPAAGGGFPAQVIATGPTVRNSAMPETFVTLMYAAHRELVITTPYYVPNDSMQAALCDAARRGVETIIVFPARNDSWEVSAASRSYYAELLDAGVSIHEYVGGLLHTKSLTVDGEVTLIGSANMDRRSFDLNYENNILFYDKVETGNVRKRQDTYLESCNKVQMSDVEAWSIGRRLWQNTVGMLGPLL
jgi:cardiolipin synthase